MINKLFVICILVDNFEKSVDFYKNKLGLEINSSEGEFADFKMEGTSLAIFGKKGATAMFPKEYMKSGGGVVIAYQVDNLAREVSRLTEASINIFEGPKETAWGQKVAYYNDPDGNILEVSQK